MLASHVVVGAAAAAVVVVVADAAAAAAAAFAAVPAPFAVSSAASGLEFLCFHGARELSSEPL